MYIKTIIEISNEISDDQIKILNNYGFYTNKYKPINQFHRVYEMDSLFLANIYLIEFLKELNIEISYLEMEEIKPNVIHVGAYDQQIRC